ncbi:9269_t:CDS:2 [Scutellospora calospora]|uniref:9269_t:CDS:1 n=1 Tax=Scutellospora calospora TaxID=85575 RepID=A0ACA9K7I0_9GLOM|nr:9269_t:CDS:2 [Scutellospora calospora]
MKLSNKARNLRAEDHYLSKAMHTSLEKLTVKRELDFEEIPTVKTIKGWIGRYSANFKREASERVLSGNNDHIAVVNKSSKHQKLYQDKIHSLYSILNMIREKLIKEMKSPKQSGIFAGKKDQQRVDIIKGNNKDSITSTSYNKI